MKVSIDWLKELVEIENVDRLVELLPLRTIGTKEVTKEFIELDMKGYNRADLLSMRGVAYEVAAITGKRVTFDEELVELRSSGDGLEVEIENFADCPIYCAAIIEGVSVTESPEMDQKKLIACGLRPVNNIVDVTNLVMLEYGQPLHAFDARSCSAGGKYAIGVRRANVDEKIKTLDGLGHSLLPSDIVIAKQNDVLGVGGIMGGKESEVVDDTTVIVLEAAVFDPVSLRRSANRLNIHSEAAKRFYHGLTKQRLMQALAVAIERYKSIGGKLKAIRVVGNLEDLEVEIPVRVERINSIIGVEIGRAQMEESLNKLYFDINDQRAKPPFWRLDVKIEADLVEEVARMYGYENIPSKALEGEIPLKLDQDKFDFGQNIREVLVDTGFDEILSYSFVSSSLLAALGSDKAELIKIANPISRETEYMRSNIWPNLLEKALENLKYRHEVRIFEIGKRYLASMGEVNEERALAVAWADGSDDPLANLITSVNQIGNKLNVKWVFEKSAGNSLFHPNRQVDIKIDGMVVGSGGEVNRRLVDILGSNQRIAVFEVKI